MNPPLHESLLRYGNAFQSIKRNRSLGIHAPHKIVLLLAILELFEEEAFKSNCIAPTQELQNHFERIWQLCVVSEHYCNKSMVIRFHSLIYNHQKIIYVKIS